MSRKGWRRIGLALGALLLAVLVGCQAVGGLDLTAMLVKTLDMKSTETSGSIDIQLDWDKEALAEDYPEAAKIADLFSHVTLTIEHAALAEDGRASIDGKIGLAKGSIPFSLVQGPDALVMRVDGMERPIAVKLDEGDEFPSLTGTLYGGVAGGGDAAKDAMREMYKKAASYLIGHAPNPPVVDVSSANEPVHGVSTALTKVHAELNGQQLGDLVPQFLDSLAKDKDGLRQLLADVVKMASELPPELQQSLGLDEEDALPSAEEIGQAVDELMSSIDEASKQVAEAKTEPEWSQIFNDDISLKVDLAVDSDLRIRKEAAEIRVGAELFAMMEAPLKGVTISYSEEHWNMNGDVQVPAADIPSNALNADEFFGQQPYKALRQIDKGSVLYDLLKNDLQIDDQEFALSSEWGQTYLTDGGVIYVPLRETLDRFGIDNLSITQNNGKYLRFYDEAIQEQVQLQIGAKTASVNGSSVNLKHPVRVVKGVTYVSADDLFGIMHAEYSISDGYFGDRELVVTRDL